MNPRVHLGFMGWLIGTESKKERRLRGRCRSALDMVVASEGASNGGPIRRGELGSGFEVVSSACPRAEPDSE